MSNNKNNNGLSNNKFDPLIVIIGAGISGLAAATKLYTNGFNNIMIFEAQDRVGGRIHTIPFGDGILELGAQWLHGQHGNPLYELARNRDLISNPDHDYGIEGQGHFLTDNGEQINYKVVDEIVSVLIGVKENLSKNDIKKLNGYKCPYSNSNSHSHSHSHSYSNSAGCVFKERFKEYILLSKNGNNEMLNNEKLLWPIFDWYMRFEIIDNACYDLNQLSLKAYTDYRECDGVSLVNLKGGYQSLINLFLNDLPEHCIKLNTHVKNIEILFSETMAERTVSEQTMPQHTVAEMKLTIPQHTVAEMKLTIPQHTVPEIKLTINNQVDDTDDEIFAQHVIVTSSIGFLKKNHKTLFTPNLPENKIRLIESLGFGTINKIFLYFTHPFWHNNDVGFQLIWTNKNHDNLPAWVYDISGFDIVKGQKNVLIGWIGGKGAEQMELIQSDELIADTCTQVLQLFLPNIIIPKPDKIVRSSWFNNQYILGAYSHPTLAYENSKIDISELSKPIYINHWPSILLAGEATDKQFYSSAHGALSSGWKQAQRLIKFWNK